MGGGYFSRKIIYNICLIVTILGLLFIVSGTSYALLSGNSSSDKEQIIKAGDVTISLSEYFENTNQKISVMSDTEGLLQEETYSFKLKNIGDAPARYDIKLVNEVPSSYSDGVIEDNYVKVGIEINGEEHGPFTLSEADNILDSGIIYENELISYEIRIWLDEDYEEEILEKEGAKGFYKIKVEAEQDVYDKTGAELIISKATEGNNEGLITIEQPATEQTEALTEYRYSGSNEVVKNYVEFNNELWRIIGVFPTDDGTGNIENRLKIIREESIGDYSWDASASGVNDFVYNGAQYYGGGVNQWGESGDYEGADLMRLLNPGYEDESINNSLYWNRGSGSCYAGYHNTTTACDFTSTGLTEQAKEMIADALWYTGAGTVIETTTAQSYEQERGNRTGIADTGIAITKTTNWIGKVALMYLSDYGYASNECYSDEVFYQFEGNDYRQEKCTSTNWLFNNSNQFTLSIDSNALGVVRAINDTGYAGSSIAGNINGFNPTLYLSSSVKITGGDGTSSNPYILSK